jgi:hypothetical protein
VSISRAIGATPTGVFFFFFTGFRVREGPVKEPVGKEAVVNDGENRKDSLYQYVIYCLPSGPERVSDCCAELEEHRTHGP